MLQLILSLQGSLRRSPCQTFTSYFLIQMCLTCVHFPQGRDARLEKLSKCQVKGKRTASDSPLSFLPICVPCPSRSRRTSRPPQSLPGCSQLTKFYPIAWHYCSLGTHLHQVLYTSIQPPLKHCKLHEIETVSFISSRHSRKILE